MLPQSRITEKKVESALLAFRGRALGCIYGQKDLDSQLFGIDAFTNFLDDLAIPESIVDTYILPEGLALSASSLFHGDVFNQPDHHSAMDTFYFVHDNLLSSQMPGCIVLKRFASDEVLAFIYMFAGQIVGIFSFANGWLDATLEQAIELVGHPTVMCSASKLNASNVEEVFKLSFSLTGMDQRKVYQSKYQPMDLELFV